MHRHRRQRSQAAFPLRIYLGEGRLWVKKDFFQFFFFRDFFVGYWVTEVSGVCHRDAASRAARRSEIGLER